MSGKKTPDVIYIPKEGKDVYGHQAWYRELPKGIPYVRADLLDKEGNLNSNLIVITKEKLDELIAFESHKSFLDGEYVGFEDGYASAQEELVDHFYNY